MELIRVYQLKDKDLEAVVDMHTRILEESFLNNFGPNFLATVYRSIANSENNIVLLSKEKDQLVGFSIATVDGDKFIQEVIKQDFWELSWEILKASALRPQILQKIIEWKMKKTTGNKSVKPELQFIAVDTPFQGQGVGTQMVERLEREFSTYGIEHYKVGTKAQNSQSNSFYSSLGFTTYDQNMIFGDLFNYYLSPSHPIA